MIDPDQIDEVSTATPEGYSSLAHGNPRRPIVATQRVAMTFDIVVRIRNRYSDSEMAA
jgi:hypothetical protein